MCESMTSLTELIIRVTDEFVYKNFFLVAINHHFISVLGTDTIFLEDMFLRHNNYSQKH